MKNTNINISLVKTNDSFNCNITKELEDKIRYLCKEIHDTEWSGVLLYTIENMDTLTVTCRDFILMDIGTATYTEYEFDNTIAEFYAENPDKLHYISSLIHSHHSMQTFFSGTDLDTLKEFGSKYNVFLSLIVNNEGTYSVAITNKTLRHFTGKVTREDFLPNNKKNSITEDYNYSSIEVRYTMGDITIERQEYPEYNNLIQEFKKKKEKKSDSIAPSLSLFPDYSDAPIDPYTCKRNMKSVKNISYYKNAFILFDAILTGSIYDNSLFDYHSDIDYEVSLDEMLDELSEYSIEQLQDNMQEILNEAPELLMYVDKLVALLLPFKKEKNVEQLLQIITE